MKLFNTAEAADFLNISPGRVKQLVADGRLVPERRAPYIFTLEALRRLMGLWEPGRSGRPPGSQNKPAPVDAVQPMPQVPVT